MRHLIPRAAFVAFALALALGCGTDGRGPKVGEPAPDFTAQTVDGQTISLAGLRGKVVVLDFWATWCPPCRAMVPYERDLVKKYEGQPLVFIGISADDDRAELSRVLSDEHIPWPNVLDGDGGPIQRLYQVESLPTIYVIDGEGIIRARVHAGRKDLDKAVAKAMTARKG